MTTEELKSVFKQRFDNEGVLYTSPGRVNLIGEHTDYNGGYVFPGAIDKGIYAVIRLNGTDKVRAYSIDKEDYREFGLKEEDFPNMHWANYIFGVCREIQKRGYTIGGFDTVFFGNVPIGAGMSSSAALESTYAFALNELYNLNIDKFELARIGQATEHNYVGVKCGIMDQFASMHGREGSLMRLDCRSGEYEYFPWHPDGYRLLLVNSCVKHELVGSPYNERRQSCERVAQLVGVETLRDCSWQQLEQLRDRLDDIDYRRARYVLGETDRVLAVCQALQQDDYEEVGRQMYLTHEGLRHDYEVSCDEIDFLVDEARRCGVSGSRIMGGGFGGCTINLVRDDRYDAFTEALPSRYKSRFGVDCQLIPVVIGPGARRIMDLEQ